MRSKFLAILLAVFGVLFLVTACDQPISSQITSYLNAQTGGTSAGDPIPLVMGLELSTANWNAILSAINTANKFIALDLSTCTRSSSSSGGGLRSGGNFDPVYSTSTGKDKIVNLTLPAVATGIAGGNSSNAAFKNFTALETVSGAEVTSIGDYAFSDCAALTSVNFPAAVAVGQSAFSGSGALTSASFPAAAAVGDSAFSGCTALTSASFPVAAAIGDYAFSGCVALNNVSFPVAAAIGDYAFSDCAALNSVDFPVAAAIGNSAFYNCGALASVSFPAAAAIGPLAFYDCRNLRFTLSGTGSLSTLEDGKMLIKNSNELLAYPSVSGAVTLPGSITTIGKWAFYECRALTSVSAPAAAAIGESAFVQCTALTSASFPAATHIGNEAFWNCGALTSVSFPAATHIGDYAFRNCGALTASFPAATHIGYAAFAYCAALTSASFPAATDIGHYAFAYCDLDSVTLGAISSTLGINILSGISARTVTVRIPASARTAYGIPNVPGTNFDNSSSANSWGRAFKGMGWNGTNYNYGTINNAITLRFETY